MIYLIGTGSHNVGVAMATSYGLVVPNIKKVQSLSILEVSFDIPSHVLDFLMQSWGTGVLSLLEVFE